MIGHIDASRQLNAALATRLHIACGFPAASVVTLSVGRLTNCVANAGLRQLIMRYDAYGTRQPGRHSTAPERLAERLRSRFDSVQ